jgi:hypothetical protein
MQQLQQALTAALQHILSGQSLGPGLQAQLAAAATASSAATAGGSSAAAASGAAFDHV